MAYEKKSIAPLRIEYWIAVCNADLYSEESALLRYLIDGRWGRNESEGVETWVRFDKEGCVIFASQIMQIFTKYSIDRVRYCLVCNRFFWAKKSNAWSCSLKCASALGHRKRGKKKNA